jgi:hypothetical protein
MRLPKSLAARIGAVAAVATIAVTGATTAASAATTPAVVHHRIPTTLTIANTLPKGPAGHQVALVAGHLTAGKFNLRHLRVWLLRQGYKGHWYVVKSELTGRTGHVLFWLRVGKHSVNVRLAFRGTKNFAPSVSKINKIPA